MKGGPQVSHILETPCRKERGVPFPSLAKGDKESILAREM